MEITDELIPLNSEDLKILEARKYSSNLGCTGFASVVFFISAGCAWHFYGTSSWLFYTSTVCSILFLLVTILIIRLGPSEDKKVLLDIENGKKRRIVAPVESKDIIEIEAAKPRHYHHSQLSRTMRQVHKSSAPINLKYSMTVKGFNFSLTEEDYLSRFRKGTLVEFHVSPNSEIILSYPIEIT